MILADYVAHFLRIQGVNHVFGLPGGENVTLIEALRTAGIDFVLFGHEAEAGPSHRGRWRSADVCR
jgi:thiamine pyrophosphate-dependent acetolactate synthase large subunit-like protein